MDAPVDVPVGASSEALVARRQTVNTYFLTVNGLLATAAGLLVQKNSSPYLSALSLFVLASVGVTVSVVWRLVLISSGQLNRRKFAVIKTMEAHLHAAVYDAQWVALGGGRDPSLYRSFTDREALVPAALLMLWTISAAILLIVVLRDRRDGLTTWLHTYNHHRAHTALGGHPPITRINNLPGHYS